jgi:hypothetical protein
MLGHQVLAENAMVLSNHGGTNWGECQAGPQEPNENGLGYNSCMQVGVVSRSSGKECPEKCRSIPGSQPGQQ